jgi:hypothetical protein
MAAGTVEVASERHSEEEEVTEEDVAKERATKEDINPESGRRVIDKEDAVALL